MTPPARFGRLARLYRWMEYLSFGPYLQRCRLLRLEECSAGRAVLVYGDGDGRFLARLACAAPDAAILAVDASEAMLAQAARRLPAAARVRLLCADARVFAPAPEPEAGFDRVVTHFFLDCFSTEELRDVVTRATAATAPGALWIVSDFALPPRAPMRQVASAVIGSLYIAFGWLTCLRPRRLPDHAAALSAAGWRREDRRELLGGLLMSERWRRKTP